MELGDGVDGLGGLKMGGHEWARRELRAMTRAHQLSRLCQGTMEVFKVSQEPASVAVSFILGKCMIFVFFVLF